MFAFLLILPACASTRYVTRTKKSGVEQLLIARSFEGALRDSITEVKGARIFIEIASLLPEQDPYVKRALEHWFCSPVLSKYQFYFFICNLSRDLSR
jgi:hypothetical protein